MIDHLLQQDCEYVRIERDGYGKPIQSDPIKVKTRANESFKMIKNEAGEEVVSSIQFWMSPNVDIDNTNITKRRIKYNGKDYTPISVRNRRDTMGNLVFKVVSV